MQIAIEVPTPSYSQVSEWMINSDGWDLIEAMPGGDRYRKGVSTVFVHYITPEGENAFDDQEATRILAYLNFGHPTRTLLELWAEIQDIPDLWDYTISTLLNPVD